MLSTTKFLLLRNASKNIAKNISAKEPNYFQLFKIPVDASDKDIKTAYLVKAKEFHPDNNQEDPKAGEKFMMIHSAYKVLSDAKSRDEYLKKMGIDLQNISKNDQPQKARPVQKAPPTSTRKMEDYERAFEKSYKTRPEPPKPKYSEQELRQALNDWQNLYDSNFLFNSKKSNSGPIFNYTTMHKSKNASDRKKPNFGPKLFDTNESADQYADFANNFMTTKRRERSERIRNRTTSKNFGDF